MQIFNIELFGTDEQWFCNLTITEQIEWIKNNTNQNNDELINEFLNRPYFIESGCVKCGKLDNKFIPNGNFSKGVSEKINDSSEPVDVAGVDAQNNSKRQRNVKK